MLIQRSPLDVRKHEFAFYCHVEDREMEIWTELSFQIQRIGFYIFVLVRSDSLVDPHSMELIVSTFQDNSPFPNLQTNEMHLLVLKGWVHS